MRDNIHVDEPTVACRCCNGLCKWHAEHPGERYEPTPEEDANDWTTPPGCWGCCGSGCRACGNTGRIPAIQALQNAQKNRERFLARHAEELQQYDNRIAECERALSGN